MSDEKRFAVIIGINDYDNGPLNYCANDAKEIKNALVGKCKFDEDDIFLIFSDSSSPIKDITGKYYGALRTIRDKISSENDSILFYFAGHGNNAFNKSNLYFHDSQFPIEEIYKDITQLKPKFQFYIIDSCQSGGKVLTRQESGSSEQIINDYIANSSGIMFLYACQSTEKAVEEEDKQHGLLTYHFLKAINNDDIYDEDGILTPGRIQEYVSKETSKSSGFNQNPVTENRITGYYPFAFNPSIGKQTPGQGANEKNPDLPTTSSTDNRVYTRDFRKELQEIAFEHFSSRLKAHFKKYANDYKIVEASNITELELKNLAYFFETIVTDVKLTGLDSINMVFKSIKKPNPNFNLFSNSVLSMIGALEESTREVPKFITDYEIDFSNEYLSSQFMVFLSPDIRKVSFGVGLLVYQAKWGLVSSVIGFMIDWDGERDSIIRETIKYDYSILLEQGSAEVIRNTDIKCLAELDAYVTKWSKKRNNDLQTFIGLTKRK